MTSSAGGETLLPKGEEGVRGRRQRHVVMKPVPGAPFKVIEAQFPFEFLMVALDPPTQLRERTKARSGVVAGNDDT